MIRPHFIPRFPAHLFVRFGLPGAFLLIFFENIGIPLPTEVVYVGAQVLINQGKMSYLSVSLLLLFAHTAGSVVAYWLGTRIALGMHKKEDAGAIQEKLSGWYKRYGVGAVFVTRFVGQVRPWSSYVAGTAEMSFKSFLIATLVGTAIFNALALAVTGRISHYAGYHPWFRALVWTLFIGGIVVVVVMELIRFLKGRRKSKKS